MAFSLSSLQSYAGKWNVVGEQLLSKADPVGFKQIKSAVVTEKQQEWGTSYAICLMMAGGTQKYIPLSRDSELGVGEEVNVKSLKIITLERDGEDPIYRADGSPLA